MIKTITLTEKEAEVVRHRATQPEAIAEVFSPELGAGNVWGLTVFEDIKDMVENTLREMIADTPGKGMAIRFDDEVFGHVEVLAELLDGNTMGGAADDMAGYDHSEPEHKAGLALRRVCNSVERKFAAAGIVAYIP